MRIVLLLFVLNICSSYLMNTRLNFMKTCFPNENQNNKARKNYRSNIVYALDKPLYTLIWYDCLKCKELITEMEKLNLKYMYIDGNIYFNDRISITNEFINPLLYKEEVLVGDNLFDIYEEIYKESDY